MSKHKRGASWSYIGTPDIKGPDGALLDLTGWQIASVGKNQAGEPLVTFECQWQDAPRQIFTHQVIDTTAWPLGPLEIDVVFTSPAGFKVYTPTTRVEIIKNIT